MTSTLLKALQNEKNEELLKYNFKKINEIKNTVITNLPLYKKDKDLLKKKLKDYRYIGDLEDLKEGSYVRWIPLEKEEHFLTIGGFVLEVNFTENGILLSIKGINQSIFKIFFDKCVLFQKLNKQEQILLLTIDYLDN
jgi:hypothetical protein